MRLRVNPSIANRIFFITAILLALMAGVTVLNAVMSTRVGSLITVVGKTYLPAYGELARSHIRALEQAFMLREAAIARLEDSPDEAAIEQMLNSAEEFGTQSERELANARDAISAHVASEVRFGDDLELGRLDGHVDDMLKDREHFKRAVSNFVAALKANDRASMESALRQLDLERAKLNEHLEDTRTHMLAISEHAVSVARADQQRVIFLTFVTLLIAASIGFILAARLARNLVASMKSLMSATEAIERGKFDSELPVTSDDEIGKLTRAFNLMIGELKLKEKIRDTFGKYVDPKVVAGLIERPELTGSGGDRRNMTVYFCDMKGFTSLSEEITPASLVTLLNRYFTLMSEEIRKRGGVVDKYMGDAVMAFWGPPFVAADQQAQLACEAALAQIGRFESFIAEVPELLGYKKFVPNIGIRIGIATGDVIVGNIGSSVSMNYTVMGDTVNTASRVEGINRVYGTRILINEATAQAVRGHFQLREVDRIVVKGRSVPVSVFEVLGASAAETADSATLIERYESGLAAYRTRDWTTAAAHFRACLDIVRDDGPAHAMLARIAEFQTDPPPPDWDGAFTMHEK
ncbi:MAG: HAMP domain-containing protein [Rhizobiales bacterium]|nr:HAMP domain-containing protein [Hyphomicrobiales bacterium]